MVLVNLYHRPLGAPMRYRAAKGFFDRLARGCGFPVRPHMLRHTAATNWEMSRVASDASFDKISEWPAPATWLFDGDHGLSWCTPRHAS